MSAVDISTKSNEAYELTKISEEPTYMSVYQWGNMASHCICYSLSTVILMLPVDSQQRLSPLTPPNLLLGTLSMNQYNCTTELLSYSGYRMAVSIVSSVDFIVEHCSVENHLQCFSSFYSTMLQLMTGF